jgi:hypothetical protein
VYVDKPTGGKAFVIDRHGPASRRRRRGRHANEVCGAWLAAEALAWGRYLKRMHRPPV